MYAQDHLHQLSFLIAPGECLLCHRPDRYCNRYWDLCLDCQSALPPIGTRCRYCAEPISSKNGICANCLKAPPPYSAVFAAFRYSHPADHLVQLFKDSGNRAAGYVMTRLALAELADEMQSIDKLNPIVLPVPLHRRKLRQRGFNQAGLIARWVAHALRLPFHGDSLVRIRKTESQRGLDVIDRRKNLRGAFKANVPDQVRQKTILLVDDVVTTTSTIREISDVLLSAGAADVIVFSLARTPSQR